MSAMRARLSHLSSAVNKKDEERAQERFMAHRYYHDVSPTTPHMSATSFATTRALQQRDVNLVENFPSKAVATLPPSTPQTRSVDAMLQLARQHASAASGVRHPDVMPTPTAASLDFSGLHTYDFQERFPTPRRVGTTVATASPADDATASTMSGHRYAQQGNAAAAPGISSADASFVSVSSSAHSCATSPSEAPFDAFRAVQERLRRKMRELTNATPAAAPKPTMAASTPTAVTAAPGETEGDTLREALPIALTALAQKTRRTAPQFEDESPPPRRPPSQPGARAATATPPRSPNVTLPPPSPAPSDHLRPATGDALRVPKQYDAPADVELSGALPSKSHACTLHHHQALYDPEEGSEATLENSRRQPRERGCEAYTPSSATPEDPPSHPSEVPCVSSHENPNDRVDVTRRGVKSKVSTAPGAFSDPVSAKMRQPLRSAHNHAVSPPAVGKLDDAKKPCLGNVRTASRSLCGSARQRRTQSRSAVTESRSSRSRTSRHTTSTSPSPSHPRERSSTGAHPPRSSIAAPRSRPISLNVEATILASVSGAELFALLRMRGLIDSEGDTEEYRLPLARCHRLYVTADEHRQLHLLRQSMQVMGEEQKDVPSYQRPTVAARSRNAEFAPPPPVTHYMDR